MRMNCFSQLQCDLKFSLPGIHYKNESKMSIQTYFQTFWPVKNLCSVYCHATTTNSLDCGHCH